MMGTASLRAVAAGALALTALTLGSCSRKPALYPVHGKVFVDDQPATGALVVFNPADAAGPLRPYGQVDQAGAFSLSSYNLNDGAPAGEYVVTVQWRRRRANPFESDGPDKLNGRYTDASKSDLKVRIEAKPNDLEPIHISTGSK